MSDNIHLVYSRRPDSISAADYDAWYHAHLDEILVVPGFVSAQRYALSPEVTDADTRTSFTHLSLYELSGTVEDAITALDEEIASGRMQLPDWFDEIRFASWNGEPVGPRVHQSS